MTRIGKLPAALCLAAMLALGAEGQGSPPEWQTRLLAEVIELRADLAEYLADAQQNRIAALTHELEQAGRDQQQMREAERQQAEQITQLERLLASPETDSQARSQIEAMRAQLIGDGAAKLRSDQAALAERSADLARRLERERQRQRLLEQRTQQVRAAQPKP
jgi:hypothetical protein